MSTWQLEKGFPNPVGPNKYFHRFRKVDVDLWTLNYFGHTIESVKDPFKLEITLPILTKKQVMQLMQINYAALNTWQNFYGFPKSAMHYKLTEVNQWCIDYYGDSLIKDESKSFSKYSLLMGFDNATLPKLSVLDACRNAVSNYCYAADLDCTVTNFDRFNQMQRFAYCIEQALRYWRSDLEKDGETDYILQITLEDPYVKAIISFFTPLSLRSVDGGCTKDPIFNYFLEEILTSVFPEIKKKGSPTQKSR